MKRLAQRWPLAFAVAILMSCSAERVGDPGAGSILVRFETEGSTAGKRRPAVRPDTLRVEVRRGGSRIASASAAVADSGHVSIDLSCPPGKDLDLYLAADGRDWNGRGAVYHGSSHGIEVQRGRTTEVFILLRASQPDAPSVEGEAGGLNYSVHWKRVEEASGYELRERIGDTLQDFATADTFRLFQPWEAKGSARISSREAGGSGEVAAPVHGRRSFQVRAHVPMGWTLFGDTASVLLDSWFDLPFVGSVTPADSMTGVRDIAEIRLQFDRPMDFAGAPDSLIGLRELPFGPEVECARHPDETGMEFALTPLEPLSRGEWYRVRVSTGLKDLEGRPIDQDGAAGGLQAFVSDFRVEEYDPLRPVSIDPAGGSQGISVTATIRVQCDRPVLRSSVTAETFVLSDSAGPIVGARSFSDSDRQLVFTPAAPMRFDLEHTVRLTSGILDAERGEPLDADPVAPGLQDFVSHFWTEIQPRGARVTETVPAANEQLHPVWVSPEVQFDRAIDPATVDPSATMSIQVLRGSSYFNLSGRWTASADETRYTFIPSRYLDRDTVHRIVVSAGPDGILDREGIPFDQDPRASGYQDFVADFRTEHNIHVVEVTPLDGATNVSWDVSVRVRFDKAVQAESVVDTTLFLLLADLPIPANRSVSADGKEATLTPISPLQSYREYRLRATSGIRSTRGGALDQDSLTAGHQGFSSRFTTVPERVAPSVVEVRPPDHAKDAPVDGVVQVFFSEPVRPGHVVQYLHVSRDSLGLSNLAGSVVVTADSLRGTFTPDEPFAFKMTYFVHVDPWVLDAIGNRFDQDPDTPGNQPFRSRFTTENEKIPPQVAAVDPADGFIGAPVAGPVRIDFTESMDRLSLPGAVRILLDETAIDGDLSYADSDRSAIWSPIVPLRYDRIYTVRVDTTAVDLAGNRLDMEPGTPRPDPFESSFTTEADTIGPRVESVYPADGSTGVEIGIVARLRFSEPIDPSSVSPASITLADSLGIAVDAVRIVDEDSQGVAISPEGPLQYETLYRITVYPTLADTSGNGYDDDPLAEGDQPFVSDFRTQTETIPPEVIALLLDGDPLVSVETDVRAVFSEPIDPESIDADSFRLLRNGIAVVSQLAVAASGDTAILSPLAPLEYATNYQVRIEGVRDRRGNIQDEDPNLPGDQGFLEEFTTEGDTEAPRVVRTVPADGASGVDPQTPLRMVFSEPMDTTSFSPSDPGLFRNDAWVPAVRTAQAGDTAFSFVADEDLEPGATYEWRAGPLLADRNGNPTGVEFTATFEVGQRPIAEAGDGVCSFGDSARVEFDASASHDPDGQIVRVYWDWGDGARDTLDVPAGLTPVHVFPCTDDAGCDGLDNDGDGSGDEEGADGCDESYRVRMTVEDADGLRSSDSTGVAFCAFRAQTSEPPDGATMVDTLTTIAIRFSRPVDPVSVDSTSVWVEPSGGTAIECMILFEDEDRVVRLVPDAPLAPDTLYTIRATGEVLSPDGARLDQFPCVVGFQPFQSQFRTTPSGAPLPRPGPGRTRPFQSY